MRLLRAFQRVGVSRAPTGKPGGRRDAARGRPRAAARGGSPEITKNRFEQGHDEHTRSRHARRRYGRYRRYRRVRGSQGRARGEEKGRALVRRVLRSAQRRRRRHRRAQDEKARRLPLPDGVRRNAQRRGSAGPVRHVPAKTQRASRKRRGHAARRDEEYFSDRDAKKKRSVGRRRPRRSRSRSVVGRRRKPRRRRVSLGSFPRRRRRTRPRRPRLGDAPVTSQPELSRARARCHARARVAPAPVRLCSEKNLRTRRARRAVQSQRRRAPAAFLRRRVADRRHGPRPGRAARDAGCRPDRARVSDRRGARLEPLRGRAVRGGARGARKREALCVVSAASAFAARRARFESRAQRRAVRGGYGDVSFGVARVQARGGRPNGALVDAGLLPLGTPAGHGRRARGARSVGGRAQTEHRRRVGFERRVRVSRRLREDRRVRVSERDRGRRRARGCAVLPRVR